MKELQIGKNDAGQRLDRFLAKAVPLLPPSLLQKYIRLKREKVNGKGSKRDVRLCEGDQLQLYINDEFFEKPCSENAFLTIASPLLDVVYEDAHILLVNKRPGQVVHADESGSANTLIDHIKAYLYQNGSGIPAGKTPLLPLCATASTAIPAVWSSPQKTPKLCA